MKWNPAKSNRDFCCIVSIWGFVSGRMPIIQREDREASLCLETRTGKVFAVIDCRVVVKFDMPISY